MQSVATLIMVNMCFRSVCDKDLSGANVYELLSTSDKYKFSSMPPTNPQGGEVYLYSYDVGNTKGELN